MSLLSMKYEPVETYVKRAIRQPSDFVSNSKIEKLLIHLERDRMRKL